MNAWISSAFFNSASTSAATAAPAISSTSLRGKRTAAAAVSKVTNANKASSSAFTNQIASQFAATTTKTPSRPATRSNDNASKKSASSTLSAASIGLAERHRPTKRCDLVVNKAKVDQLDQMLGIMLDASASSSGVGSKKPGPAKPTILILDGPSGCGKYVILIYLIYSNNTKIREALKMLSFSDDAQGAVRRARRGRDHLGAVHCARGPAGDGRL